MAFTISLFQKPPSLRSSSAHLPSQVPPKAQPEADLTPSSSPVHNIKENNNNMSSPATLKSCLKTESRSRSLGRDEKLVKSVHSFPVKVNFKADSESSEGKK